LDRTDVRLETPENAVVLASSEGHSRDYTLDEEGFFVLVHEEQLTHTGTWPGLFYRGNCSCARRID